MKRHLMKGIAVSAALLMVTTACGGGSDEPAKTADGKEILTVSIWNYAQTPEFKALFDAFEADNPTIDIQPVDILADDYSDKVTTMLAGGDKTDVLTMKNVTDYARYGTRGQLTDLTGTVNGLPKESYLGLDALDLEGRYYALPYRQDFWVLYYNKKLVGDTDMSNLTWAEYAALAKSKTTGDGAAKVYGSYQHVWRSVVQAVAAAQTGGDQLGGDYAWMTDQYTMTLDLEAAGAIMPWGTANSQKVTYDSQFSTGKAAMLPMGAWYSARLLADKAAGKHDVDWGVAPLPQTTKGAGTKTFGSPTAFAVNKNARNSAAATTFVTWASGEKGATAVARIGIYPSFTNDAVLAAYAGVAGMPTDEVAKKAFAPASVMLEMPVSDKSSDVDTVLKEEHELIMSGEKSVADGIKEMNDRVKNEVG
ncbi:ABC transporter substrate-binding protein [Catenuloplanes sp. NPDC051500]|uniref:ABC transporter substrate-binding protein n=1 Tax=Catenuloplanes sp. NPDC051500 TaxID=3363959 RepID=UPI00378EFC25